LVGQPSTEAKVDDLDLAMDVEEDVVGLDVALNDTQAVQMTEVLVDLHAI
jgi:hypothetical protein